MCVGSRQAGVRFALSKRRLRRGHVIKKQGGEEEEEERGREPAILYEPGVCKLRGAGVGDPAGGMYLTKDARAFGGPPGAGIAACVGVGAELLVFPPSLGIPSGEGAAPAV